MASGTHAVPFSAARALQVSAAIAATGLSLSVLKLATGVGISCPWRALTGTLCPFCGGTTMGTRLLVGDLAGAWTSNPFALVLLGLGGLATIAWAVEAAGGPALRPPARLRSSRLWWGLLGAAAIAFMVVRNL